MTVFTVIGTPKPQGSKRAFVHGNRAMLVESAGQPLKDWRTDVQQAALAAHDGPPLEGPVNVELIFKLARPKSVPASRRPYPTTRPDIDKLTRAVLDALTHVCYLDDAQIVSLDVRKAYGQVPGVMVAVEEWTEGTRE